MPKKTTSHGGPNAGRKTATPASGQGAIVVYGSADKLSHLQRHIQGVAGLRAIPVRSRRPIATFRVKADFDFDDAEDIRTRTGDSPEAREILARIETWAGSKRAALAWFRSQPISALGDQTAEGLVRSGQADLVRAYLDAIAAGGYA